MALMGRLSINKSKFVYTTNLIKLFPALQKSSAVDKIDSFTTDLVERKALKWELLRKNIVIHKSENDVFKSNFNMITTSVLTAGFKNDQTLDLLDLNIDKLSIKQLDAIILSSLETKNYTDFYYIIKQCLSQKIIPEIIIECLRFLSFKGDVETIEEFSEILLEKNSFIIVNYNNLLPFKGLALWKSGKTEIALKIFLKSYITENGCLHKNGINALHSIFKVVTEDTFMGKSEAVLVCLLKTAKNIYKNHDDIFLLACIWRNAFLSDWFSDQKLSQVIFDEYEEIRTLVSKRITSFCSTILRRKDTEAVYKLIELFLKYDNRKACENCLHILFDYQYFRNDLRACAEIIKFCTHLEIPVSDAQNQKLLNLLLKDSPPVKRSSLKQPNFEYKF